MKTFKLRNETNPENCIPLYTINYFVKKGADTTKATLDVIVQHSSSVKWLDDPVVFGPSSDHSVCMLWHRSIQICHSLTLNFICFDKDYHTIYWILNIKITCQWEINSVERWAQHTVNGLVNNRKYILVIWPKMC